MMDEKNRVSWPGWITEKRICGQGSGSLWKLSRGNGKESAMVKYISVPWNAWETEELRRQGKSPEHIRAYYDYICRNADAEYDVSRELEGCRHVAVYRDIRKSRTADGLGWEIYLMMDPVTPIDRFARDLSEVEILKMGRQICMALEDSNRAGLLHGRITPRCIFRDEKGDYLLGGFAGEHFGDLGDFRAPEVAESKFSDSRADVYSLGLVLYWLLNDRKLPGRNLAAPKNGSEKLKTVVMKAIAPQVSDRYQTPEELGAALESLVEKRRKRP